VPDRVHHHIPAALGPEQRAKATFGFTDDERMNWHFIPKVRQGLTLGEMTPWQRHLANALLAAGLSQTGYIKAVTIMSLEDVLKTLENDRGDVRTPEKYHFTLFGTPSDTLWFRHSCVLRVSLSPTYRDFKLF